MMDNTTENNDTNIFGDTFTGKQTINVNDIQKLITSYEDVYKNIKQNKFLNSTKNFTSQIIKFVFLTLSTFCFLIFVACLFPKEIALFMERKNLIELEVKEFILSNIMFYIKYLFLLLGVNFYIIARQIKKNIIYRKNSHSSTLLVKDIIESMKSLVKNN